MLYELPAAEIESIRPLLDELKIHLVADSVLAGITPAQVYVDEQQPALALVLAGHRYLLLGAPGSPAQRQELQRLLLETIFPQKRAAGEEMFGLYYADPAWKDHLPQIIPYPLAVQREYYICRRPLPDPFDLLPEIQLRPVDAALLAETGLGGLDDLQEEMCSERSSIGEFLAHSFGICAIHAGELAGWCLSEYNSGSCCEVGIETRIPYRRRGLATSMTRALVAEAFRRGLTQVGWHCFAENLASANTARKAGFEKVCDYSASLCWYDEAVGLTVSGNQHLERSEFAQAMHWYQTGLERGLRHRWLYWSAGRAAAALGQEEAALNYLGLALEAGFDDLERLQSSEYLRSLHGSPGWLALVERFATARDNARQSD